LNIEHGVNVNQKGIQGETPLLRACQRGHENIVKYLVEHGANVNIKTYTTPLKVACENGNERIIKYLLEHGADINDKEKEYI